MEKRVRSSFAAILILVCSGFLQVEGFNCTHLLTGCICKGPSVDIDISKAFDYPYNITNNPLGDNPQKYSYMFSPCSPLKQCGPTAAGNTVLMCQLNLQDDTRDVALGINAVPGVEWEGDDPKSFTLRYKGGDPDDKKKERWTEITVTVGGKVDEIIYVDENDVPSDHHSYTFKMTLKSDTPNISSAKPVGYVGIAIILIAILSLVLYFIIGTAILYFVKGARGLEAFPNYGFWKDLPVLIKDGCCFTISPCRNKIGNQGKYQPL